MLQIIFLSLIFLIFFLLFFLLLPYHYSLSFQYQEKLNYYFSFSVIFIKIIFEGDTRNQSLFLKIFNFTIRLKKYKKSPLKLIENESKKIIKKNIKNTAAETKKPKQKKTKNKLKFDFSLINRENLNHIFGFIIQLLKIMKFDYLKLKLNFSFADPYYNGIFLAYYQTLKELFDYPDLQVKINWQEVIFEANGSVGGKIVLLKIIYQILSFIFSLKTLKIFWRLYRTNSKKG